MRKNLWDSLIEAGVVAILAGCFAAPGHAQNAFMAGLNTLEIKSEHCRGEIMTASPGPMCRDFQAFSKAFMIGDSQQFIRMHLSNGDITTANARFVSDVLKSADETEAMLH